MRDIIRAIKVDEKQVDLRLNGSTGEIMQTVIQILERVAQGQRAAGNTKERVAADYRRLCDRAVDRAFSDGEKDVPPCKWYSNIEEMELPEDIKASLGAALADMLLRGMR